MNGAARLWGRLRGMAAERKRPLWMGILNATPDSFSDGGEHTGKGAAGEWAASLAAAGADVVDVGGESTRPGHAAVGVGEEVRRVGPAVREAVEACPGIAISVDTRRLRPALAAFGAGAGCLNDVSALASRALRERMREREEAVVLCRGWGQGLPRNGKDVAASVAEWLRRRAEWCGVAAERIWVDPGIGFGTTRAQDMAMLEGMGKIAAAGYPVVVGLSRKRVVRECLARDGEDLDVATARASWEAWRAGAAMLRVHRIPAGGALDGGG